MLSVDVAPGTPRTRAAVAGEIDLDCAPSLEEHLLGALGDGVGHLHLDLTAVTFCDTSGLNVLLRLRRAAEAAGIRLTVEPGDRVAYLFAMSGTSRLFPADDTPPPVTVLPA